MTDGAKKRDIAFTAIAAAFTAIIFFIPTGFDKGAGGNDTAVRVKARVLYVDNSLIKNAGPVKYGEQSLSVRVLGGPYAGQVFQSSNDLVGKMELDKLFAAGDDALAILSLSEDRSRVLYATVFEHYRTDKTFVLAGLFFAFLVLISGWTGFKAIVSFVFSGAMIIRVLLPAMLRGVDPVLASLGTVTVLTAVIVFLVGGLSRKGLTAFAGSMGGVILTAVLSWAFTHWFDIHGAVRPFAETLIYNGYQNLNLVNLFIAGVFLASSGAVMDLAMDIAAAMSEIREQQPAISRLGLIRCGFSVARHVTGTMTTTLLLAYSAQYTAMLMAFIAQGVPFQNVINMVFVSSEVLHTLVGSFGLILVAPLTAVSGGMLLVRPKGQITG